VRWVAAAALEISRHVRLGPNYCCNIPITQNPLTRSSGKRAYFSGTVQPVEESPVNFDPNALAVQYYFGDLQYWKLPGICIEALEHGFDGRALRRLSGLLNPVESDIRKKEIDSAFCEMGVKAPIPKDEARLVLATDAVRRALAGGSNVFNEATHIRIHICELHDPPTELQPIVALSEKSEHAPSRQWKALEKQLRDAMTQFLNTRE